MYKNRNREKKYVYYLKKYGGRSKEKNIFRIYFKKKYENREKHIERQNTHFVYLFFINFFLHILFLRAI